MEGEWIERWGPLSGIVGAVIFLSLWGAAVIVDGNWIFGVETLSELGGDRPGRLFFNSAVIIMGLFTLLFAASLHHKMRRSLAGRSSAMAFGLSAVLLIGVGVFPIDTGESHSFFALSFFFVVILSLTYMFVPCHQRMGIRSPGTLTLGAVIVIAYSTIALVMIGMIDLALSEALVVIALNIWQITNGVLMLLHRERDVIPCVD